MCVKFLWGSTMLKSMMVAAVLASSACFPVCVSASAIDSVMFENRTAGAAYTNALAKLDFPARSGASNWYAMEQNGGANASVVFDSLKKSNVLRLKYPAGCLGPNDSPLACAGQIRQPLPQTSDTMWVAYDLMFESGFDFIKGGKLPGLCGGKCYTGGNRPSVGDGWSARVMWRTGGAAVQYLYFVDQAATYGDDAKWDLGGTVAQKTFVPGKWHRLVTQVVLNSVSTEGAGDKNGKIRSWFDGSPALSLDTLRLRDYAAQTIDAFYLSTFFGGSDSTWSPLVDSYVRFDDFVVSKDSIPVGDAVSTIPLSQASLVVGTYRWIPVLNGCLELRSPLARVAMVRLYALDGSLLANAILPAGSSEYRFSAVQPFSFAVISEQF